MMHDRSDEQFERQPSEGRPIAESRRIALEIRARFERLADAFDLMTIEEQERLVEQSERLVEGREE